MKKLSLTLNDLQIESFTTFDEAVARAKTVRAHISLNCASISDCETCGCGTRYEGGTCDYPTCVSTCAGGTCQYQTCNHC
ncbi:MAG TPA: hypothetical protein VFJ16_02390 [Longimicrobium sp.]|nr:hypothetical protein [Longimicrobium sp.]